MDILLILKIIAALGTVATGLLAFLKPAAAFGFTGLNASGRRGIVEMRSIFGGLFIGLGLAPFFFGATAYQVLGIAYLAIAAARAVSTIFDKSYESSNIISLVVEIIFGVILII